MDVLQSIASITNELWPSISSVFAAPLRGGTPKNPLKQTTVPPKQVAGHSTAPDSTAVESHQYVSDLLMTITSRS